MFLLNCTVDYPSSLAFFLGFVNNNWKEERKGKLGVLQITVFECYTSLWLFDWGKGLASNWNERLFMATKKNNIFF